MKNPNPVNIQTSEKMRENGWQAESRDADGHLISCHAPIKDDDPGIAEWIVECISRGETVTFWPEGPATPPQTNVNWQAIAEHYRYAILEVERRISAQPVKEALPGQPVNETAKFISEMAHTLWEARQKVIFKEPLDGFSDTAAPPVQRVVDDLDKTALTIWRNMGFADDRLDQVPVLGAELRKLLTAITPAPRGSGQ